MLAQSQAQVQTLTAENQLLRQKIEALIRRYFGHAKNEGLDPAQLEWLLLGLTPKVATPEPAAKTSTPAPRTNAPRPAPRRGIPEDLPTVREVLLPEEVKANPEAFRQIDARVTKELDWEAAKFYWRHIVRPKFGVWGGTWAKSFSCLAAVRPSAKRLKPFFAYRLRNTWLKPGVNASFRISVGKRPNCPPPANEAKRALTRQPA